MSQSVKVVDLDETAAAALRSTIISLADSKRILGIRYSDWLLGAPSIEAGVAASSMSQDEWGHARLLYAMLKDFGLDPVEIEHDREAREYGNVGALDTEFTDWAAFVVAVSFVDGALSVILEGLSQGTYEMARSRVPKMLAEEAFHADLGSAWIRRLSTASEEARNRLQSALQQMLPDVFAYLEPQDEVASTLSGAGLIPEGAELKSRYMERVGPLLEGMGVRAEEIEVTRDGWDPERRRGAGQPDVETMERARGDRNRQLFVE